MAVEFQCEECGQLLMMDVEPGATVACTHCHTMVVVPEALASLPQPQVPPDQSQRAGTGDDEMADEEELLEEEERPVVMTAMAKAMPWVISIFFHLGLGLIFMFVAMIVKAEARELSVTIPDAILSENPGGVVNPGRTGKPDKMTQRIRKVKASGDSTHERDIPADDTGETDERVTLIGSASGGATGGALADFGLTTGGSGSGPRSNFGGLGGNAHHIVYLIDRSGSMIDTFPAVREEIISSVSGLQGVQDFHVILFAEGRPLEKNPPGLTLATEPVKLALAKFLEPVRAERQTDPVPAVIRAFEVLAGARLTRGGRPTRGKLVYLLTDGVFPDYEKVLQTIRERNVRKDVLINTFLYGFRPPLAEKIMKQIASENGGRFRYISPDE